MEQRLIRQQQAMFEQRAGVGGGGAFFPPPGGQGANNPPPRPEPTEESIQTLVDMGFDRERVRRALRQSGNDIQSATAILLHGGDAVH